MPLMTEMWAVEYDFVNNNFRGFQIYDDNMQHTPEQALDFIASYNNKTLKADKILSYGWTWATMVNGNITNDVNKLSFSAYSSYSYSSENPATQLEVTEFYNALYKSLNSFKLRTPEEMIGTENEEVHLVSYVQDCVNYGWNKSEVHTWSGSGRTYYVFFFLEYEEMVSMLSEIKTTILADENATTEVKELATFAHAYVEEKGKVLYTGQLGTYNGLKMNMETYSTWRSEDTHPVANREITTEAGTKINFNIVDGHVADLTYNKIAA